MPLLKPLHLAVGFFGLIAFVLTGQYMAMFLGDMSVMPDGPRLLYRTSHLYLMWASLANLLVGSYFVAAETRNARIAQWISSALVFASPVLMLAGFFIESPTNNLDRVLTGWGNYFGLAGVVLHVGTAAVGARRNA